MRFGVRYEGNSDELEGLSHLLSVRGRVLAEGAVWVKAPLVPPLARSEATS